MKEAQEAAMRKPKNVNVSIRKFKDSDEAKVMEIFDGVNADAHCFLPQDTLDEESENCKNAIKRGETWVAEKGKEVIGFINLIDDSSIAGMYVKKII